jgi:ABC-2 type transport system permease protein
MNYQGIKAIFKFEMNRALRTIGQTLIAPIISTALYFIVFGSTIGNRIGNIDGINYGAFIVPGLIMLSILGQSISNASFGIYLPRYTGTIYEILSAPLSPIEIAISYIGAASTKSILIGTIVILTTNFFTPLEIQHPYWMMFFLVMTSITFSALGFIIGIWVDGFDKLQVVPLLIITPLTFLGGSFYSIDMLPPIWKKISLFNPVVYLINGFRWSFHNSSEINPAISIVMLIFFITLLISSILWIWNTGYKIKN